MRKIVKTDRALHDKAQRGFVSWVQAFRKHELKSIFLLGDLDWGDLGDAWALLKMPKMPELWKWEGDRSLGVTDIDWRAYKYKDRKREEGRVLEMEAYEKRKMREGEEGSRVGDGEQPAGLHGKRGTKRAWSDKFDAKEQREERQIKRQKKKKREKEAAMTPAERRHKMELDGMIEEVRKQTKQKAEGDRYEDEFHGFD